MRGTRSCWVALAREEDEELVVGGEGGEGWRESCCGELRETVEVCGLPKVGKGAEGTAVEAGGALGRWQHGAT